MNRTYLHYFFCSLLLTYDTLFTALGARLKEELFPAFIQSKPTDEYNRRIENSESANNAAKAFKAHRKFRNND